MARCHCIIEMSKSSHFPLPRGIEIAYGCGTDVPSYLKWAHPAKGPSISTETIPCLHLLTLRTSSLATRSLIFQGGVAGKMMDENGWTVSHGRGIVCNCFAMVVTGNLVASLLVRLSY